MTSPAAGRSVPALHLWEAYSREDVHDIFDPQGTFTPQAGTWGLQGIVRVPDKDGDFVFFVTFGTSAGDHDFEEEITEDGVLTWQSQPKQRLDTPTIQRLVSHNDLTNSIHLFLRTKPGLPYTYFGELGYLEHDPTREAPVYFTWQLMNWPPPASTLSALDITPTSPADPVSPLAGPGTLTLTDPPDVPGRRANGAVGGRGKRATLPGQDAKNRRLGLAGEQLVLKAEEARLRALGLHTLADQIVHVAAVEGDSAGYDIRSFQLDGSPRHIEVKTTKGPASNAFYISPNELKFSREHADSYVLLRVYGYSEETGSANCYEIPGDVVSRFDLTATEYRATLGSGGSINQPF